MKLFYYIDRYYVIFLMNKVLQLNALLEHIEMTRSPVVPSVQKVMFLKKTELRPVLLVY